ncbi:SDR family NAD(P)-dependent oxidoreductase [Lysinibacillus sp. NPDC058147]|uniref:SDR family NAD(P)-dependent oxidoreductase n=1 Tax=unclassified Lysinibacillus TaxID=2636778 RepID=UPI0036D7893A
MNNFSIELDSLSLNDSFNNNETYIKEVNNNDIAIIGMAVKFPMADTLDEYWNNIANGINCIRDLPEQRELDAKNYLKYNGKSEDANFLMSAYLEDIDKFDYDFFRITPKDASLMNPVQRIFLEVSWAAIENAGYAGEEIEGSKTGVYLGFISDLEGYKYKEMIHDLDPHSLPICVAGNLSSMVPARISYLLNLKGPSMLIDTACSSSLVSVDIACKALRNGDCDMALAGGARLGLLPIDKEYFKIGIESSDSFTRSLDEYSDGSGLGEGIGAVLLKPLRKAMRDNDNIYAVIKGSTTNQDGQSMGITAPNPIAHKELLTAGWNEAGINPETLDYIEVHGSGTKLGDAIEIDGLKNAFGMYTDKKQFCAISSIKSNIGHLYEGAGIAGLIKAVLALKNKKIPPSLHFNVPNKNITFNDSPLYINTKLRDWEQKDYPRRCGISSFGISGTNCHVVLEEAPKVETTYEKDGLQILTLSAKKPELILRMVDNLYQHLLSNSNINFSDVCYTLNTGRNHFKCRLAIVADSTFELLKKLRLLLQSGINGQVNSGHKGIYYGEHHIVSEENAVSRLGTITESTKRRMDTEINEFMERHLDNLSHSNIVDQVCRSYIVGAKINWNLFYRDGTYFKVNLPGYTFDKKRCWLDIPDWSSISKDDTKTYYKISWDKRRKLEAKNDEDDGTIIVINHSETSMNEIISNYKKMGRNVVEVSYGDSNSNFDGNSFTITGSEEEYTKLFEHLRNKSPITKIIHAASWSQKFENTISIHAIDDSIHKSVESLLYLTRALVNGGFEQVIDLVIITENANEVDGTEEVINPLHASLIGFGKVLRKEHPNLRSRCIDVDKFTKLEDVINELESDVSSYQVAYRRGERYVEVFKEVSLEEQPHREIPFYQQGVYMITGGTGGIGLEVANFLSSKLPINIALLNRTPMPDRRQWDRIIEENQDRKTIEKITHIQQIESSGATVQCISVDVSNKEEMSIAVSQLREKFGRINGVFHCAGVGNPGEILQRDIDQFLHVIRPKIHGTRILDELTEQDKPDFFILFSSISTLFPAHGQSDYVAANAFLDAYSQYRNKNGKPTLSINWTTWKETGMAFNQGFVIDTMFNTMTSKQAMRCLDEVMSRDIKNVLIGEMNAQWDLMQAIESGLFEVSPAIKQWVQRRTLNKKQKNIRTQESIRNTVKLLGEENFNYSDIEVTLANLCKEVLGFEEIDIYDSFFELGADSILLKRMYSRLEEIYPGKLLIADLFEYSSISRLAEYIAGKETEIVETVRIPKENVNMEEAVSNILDALDEGDLSLDEMLKSLEKL